MSDIFIAYDSEDRNRVKSLADALERKGWSIWWDQRSPVSRAYDEVIEEALGVCKAVVVVWAKTSVNSTWVKNEARKGLKRRILFPVILFEEAEIPLEFIHLKAARLNDWQPDQDHTEFDQFVAGLAKIIGFPSNSAAQSLLVTKNQAPSLPPSSPVPVPKSPSSFEGQVEAARRPFEQELSIDTSRCEISGVPVTLLSPAGAMEKPKAELPPANKDCPSESTVQARSVPLSRYFLTGIGLIVAVGAFVGQWILPPIPSPIIPRNPSAFQATEESLHTQGQRITSNPGPASMVLVPAGEFMMGSHQDGRLALKDEWPTHPVYLDAFYIDQYEVTTAHYAKFFQETQRLAPKYWSEQVLKQHERKPVVGVDWEEAAAYCSWSGKRLPTEAEWEKAARGTDQRLYPWGDVEPSRQRANTDHCCKFNDYGVLTNIGSFEGGKSSYGIYDMAGNVWEWVADWYGGDYYGKSPERNPTGPSMGEKRVLRGGGWDSAPVYVRSAYRLRVSPKFRLDNIGFRCARDVPK